MELLKNLEGLSADEQMTAVVELQKAAMKHLEEQKQASIGKSAELVIQGLKKIKSDFEAKFDSLNYDIQTKVASLKDGEQGLQGPKGDQGERGLDGANGRDGRDGKDGKDGLDGVDGVGVRDAKIDFDGSLVISLTDGREINCGEVVSVDVAKQIQKVTHNIQTGAGGDSQTVLDAIAAIQATIATYGTMATQNKTSVDIEGGTIDNTTIGATTPSTGVFTTLTAQNETLNGTGQNLLLQSQTFTSGSWTNVSVTVTANSTTAPDGTTTASTIAASSTGSARRLFQSFTTSGFVYTVSFYAKPLTTNWVYIQLSDLSANANGYYFNVATGAVGTNTGLSAGSNVTLTSSAVTSAANGFYRCSIVFTTTNSGSYAATFGVVDANSSSNVTSGASVYFWGAQVELGSTLDAYTPTTTTAVYGTPTLSFSGVASLGLQSDGSLYETSAGTGNVRFYTNNIAQEQMRVSHTASAVNYVQVTGAATTNRPAITAQGSDNNISLNITSKGGSSVYFNTGAGTSLEATSTGTAVNYLTATGVATTLAPSLKVNGSDTNIPIAFQSKGTGAIDLAAGSSGVNISNGGTVTALTVTNSGTSPYTSHPTPTISAPTTAGGVQAVATANLNYSASLATTTIISGGTGYTLNDTLTVVGGTFTAAAVFTVSGVSGGVVTAITGGAGGTYSAIPTGTLSVTGGTGSGFTLTINGWAIRSLTISNAGSGYVEQPTVTFSGGGGSGAAAYATVGSGTTVKSLGSTMSFHTPAGEQFRVQDSGTTSANYWIAQGIGAGNSPYLIASGSDSNVGGFITSKGTGALALRSGSGGTQLQVAHTASAVNYVQVTGSATGGAPYFIAQGSDANVNLWYGTKGTGYHAFFTAGNGSNVQFLIANTASAVNYVQTTGSTTGFGAKLFSAGSDTNIPLVLQPKGTGALQAQQTDSTATGGNARGANAVDFQTVRNNAANVASGTLSVVVGGASNRASGGTSAVLGGNDNISSGTTTVIAGGAYNNNSGFLGAIGGGSLNAVSGAYASVSGGQSNTAAGTYNFIGAGFTNSGTANAAVTTQSGTMNGTVNVTLSASNANIKVGQLVTGSVIGFIDTYVAAISGTSLTLSKVAVGSGTTTLSFFTPHGVVVGGGNNQATGAYSFIGGGGDAGTAANRNVASGDWSVVAGGRGNTASGVASFVGGGGTNGASIFSNIASGTWSVAVGGISSAATGVGSFVGGGYTNTANGQYSSIVGGARGFTRGITGNFVFSPVVPIVDAFGVSQAAILILGRQTTDATATVLCSDSSAAGTTNQVILPNNSAYYFKGTVIANVTGGGNTKGWTIEGAIKRGANAASTALVGTPTVTSSYADAGASTWAITATADTTNGGLAITFTGQAGTTIRVVAKLETTEVTF